MSRSKMLSKVNYKIYHDEQQNVKLSTSPPPKIKSISSIKIIVLVTPFHWRVFYPEALTSVVSKTSVVTAISVICCLAED